MSSVSTERTSHTTLAAAAGAFAAAMPILLIGGLGVLIQEELAFGETRLGGVIASFYAMAAVLGPLLGRVVERHGPSRSARVGIASIVLVMVAVAIGARSWLLLVLMMGLGGIAHQTTMLSVTTLLARDVVADRQGFAFGVTQAAVPLTALVAGLAVPTVGLTLGWRWVFAGGAVLAVLCAVAIPNRSGVVWRVEPGTARSDPDAPMAATVIIAAGAALAATGSAGTIAFLVPTATARGVAIGNAGLIFALASCAGIVVRFSVGWLSDRVRAQALGLIALLLAFGAVGFLGLAFASGAAGIAVFALFAIGGGWGWTGLLMLAVSRSNPTAPGNAMGIVVAGGAIGQLSGPILFGLLAENVSFAAGWLLCTGAATLGAAAFLIGWRMIDASSRERVRT